MVTVLVVESILASNKEGWIVGRGWDQDLFESKRFIQKEDLDSITPDQPVRLSRVCGHIIVVNSYVLKILGINQNTQDPDGGEIERDINGYPNILSRFNFLVT